MYNLHCHSLLSDGVLLPSEIARRYEDKGYRAIAITDHADYSNIELVVRAMSEFTKHRQKNSLFKVLSGVELTHLPLEQFGPLAKYCRDQGIQVIVAHGETLVEPVLEGTNRAALEADIDILAHPGLISVGDAELAKEKGIFLELTSRSGHRDTNTHVAEQALKSGARLILNNDSHNPEDIISPAELSQVGLKAGLSQEEIDKIYQEVENFIKKKGAGR